MNQCEWVCCFPCLLCWHFCDYCCIIYCCGEKCKISPTTTDNNDKTINTDEIIDP